MTVLNFIPVNRNTPQVVISAFPGTGKSFIFKNQERLSLDGKVVFDSDSSTFDKQHFPANYIAHIKSLLADNPHCLIMVSSHAAVRQAMREAGIDYILVYPDVVLKPAYLDRYNERGSPRAFCNMMDEKWEDFIESCMRDTESGTPSVILLPEETLAGVIVTA